MVNNLNDKPRVLFVSNTEIYSGGEIGLFRLLKSNSGIVPTLITPEGRMAELGRAAGIDIVVCNGIRRLSRQGNPLWPLYFMLRLVQGFAAVWRTAVNRDIQIIHANSLGAGIYCLLPALVRGTPFVWTQHVTSESPLDRWITRHLRHFAAGVVAISGTINDELVARGLPPGAIRIIYNGIDTETEYNPDNMDAGHLRDRYGIGPETRIVAISGMITPWKGFHVFLDAAARIAEENQDVVFFIIGKTWNTEDAAYEEELRNKSRERTLSGRVYFTGFVDDMPAALRDVDVFVHASIRPEPFGNVLIEAMSMKCVTIASRFGGPAEVIQDGVDGFLIEPDDPAVLATKIIEALSGQGRLGLMAENAREKIRMNFSTGKQVEKFNSMYQEILEAAAEKDH